MNGWESFIISLDILTMMTWCRWPPLRIFHYQPWYTYGPLRYRSDAVENLSLSALIYLNVGLLYSLKSWESFIISLDILTTTWQKGTTWLRIFHYQPWYTYCRKMRFFGLVENLSLSALIYLTAALMRQFSGWESFIISLDILRTVPLPRWGWLRIFHYQPWYT